MSQDAESTPPEYPRSGSPGQPDLVESRGSRGRRNYRPDRRPLTIDLTPDQMVAVRRAAKRQGVSLRVWIGAALTAAAEEDRGN